MTTYVVLLSGLFFAASFYLILSRQVIRLVLGIALLGNAVNLLLFASGRITRSPAPIISAGQAVLDPAAANALPQALILTAIVISFSFLTFMLVLIWRVTQRLKTGNSDHMRLSEPVVAPMPPADW
jgi:multicomponent Na+:H+ antiporter subunit C